MDMQGDHMLVVNLENCISTDVNRHIGKSGSCIYTASNGCNIETNVVQIATPLQFGDVRQSLPRLQHQHLAHLQPIQYSQVNYDTPPHQVHQHGHTLYQPVNPPPQLHHYTTPSQPAGIHHPYINPIPTTQLLHHHHLQAPTQHVTPVLAPNPFPQPPPEPFLEPTFPEDGFEYYNEIHAFLMSQEYPNGVSDNYKKHLRKRARHYLLIDGKLHHGHKQPKEVIMKKEDQKEILKRVHVIEGSGIHLGVKKMFKELHSKYFWRGMYTDVVMHAKNCDKCSDAVDMARRKEKKNGSGEEENDNRLDEEDEEDVDCPSEVMRQPEELHCRSQSTETVPRVWRKVEVQLNGPYRRTSNRNEYIVAIVDPESQWVCARAIPSSSHSTRVAEFILHTFCCLGFTRCSLVSANSLLFDAVASEFASRVSSMADQIPPISHLDPSQSQCPWLPSLLNKLVKDVPTKWDREIDHFLFQLRTGVLPQLSLPQSLTPFAALFNRSPFSFTTPDDDKENVVDNLCLPHRRKLQNSRLQCRHCEELFTSKISFRIHQRKHIEEARSQGRLPGEAMPMKKKLVRKVRSAKPMETTITSKEELSGGSEEWVGSTVCAVKALIAATKEERRRRGKYHKYTAEMQEQIAVYAMKHGNQQAVKYFSERLGTIVSESTIRNLVKSHSAFTPSLKEEIGRFAANFGVEAATRYFSVRLERGLSQTLVRKFKAIHLGKLPDAKRFKDKKQKKGIEKLVEPTGKGVRYSAQIKEEIGCYACHHSLTDTAEHFSRKFQVAVKERTVKRFHKAYVEKYRITMAGDSEPIDGHPTMNQLQTVSVTNQSYNTQFVQTSSSLYAMNPCSNGSNICCQQPPTASVIMTQNSSFNYHVGQVQPYQPSQEMYHGHPSVMRVHEQEIPLPQSDSSCVMSQPHIGPHFMTPQNQNDLTEVVSTPGFHKTTEQDSVSHMTGTEFSEGRDFVEIGNTIIEGKQDTEFGTLDSSEKAAAEKISENSGGESGKEDEPTTNVAKKGTVKREGSTKKRGSYTTYSPELRADIGKFAAENGSLKASQHFALILGHEVPESTARGLKEKYLLKKKHCKVTSLGYSQRGRPLRLGKYDEVVQECLKELVRSGEKVSSYLAITTAKQILSKHDPSLLEDNGGPVKLNITWAKSFLKRIGVRNNS